MGSGELIFLEVNTTNGPVVINIRQICAIEGPDEDRQYRLILPSALYYVDEDELERILELDKAILHS